MVKSCGKCGCAKPLEDFPKHPECKDGRKGVCKVCTYALQKERVKRDGHKDHKAYRRTVNGYLVGTYSNMVGRVLGNVKPHLYKGLPILSKEEFYAWAKASQEFHRLFEQWVASGYDRKLTPSIDRKDTALGYTLDNIRWLTHSENSRLGGQSPK